MLHAVASVELVEEALMVKFNVATESQPFSLVVVNVYVPLEV